MRNLSFVNSSCLSTSLCLASKSFLVVCSCLLLSVAHAELSAAENNVTHSPAENANGKEQRKFLVGFAQDTMSNDWRKQQVKDVERELAHRANIRFIATDARGQTAKQILDIENLVKQGIDLLITSPRDAKALAPVISNTYKKGIPVVLLSRKVEGNDYTVFIGPDNLAIGKQAALVLGKKLAGKGRIVILKGIPTATTAVERTQGFKDGLSAYPGLSVVAEKTANYLRADAILAIEEVLSSKIEFDAIYAQSDSMAVGARMALTKAGIKPGSIRIVGIDYIKEAREAIRRGEQDATFTYPTGGKEGAYYILQILKGHAIPKRVPIPSVMVEKANVEKIKPIF